MKKTNKKMADSKDDKMEEDWEYYDDNQCLPDFWQVGVNYLKCINLKSFNIRLL